MGNQSSEMHVDTAVSELELQEMKAPRYNSPRTAERMKNSVKQVEEEATELSQFAGGSGNRARNNARDCYNGFADNFWMMLLGCFGMSLGDEHEGIEENIRSPLITGSTKIAADIEGSGSGSGSGSGKKSFLEWLNHRELDQSDEEWESTLTRLKDGVIQLGIRFSHLLLRFLILASERGDNKEIFDIFRDILGPIIHGDNETFVVVKRVLNLVEKAEKAVANLKNKGQEILIFTKRKDSIDLALDFCSQILALHLLVSEDMLTKSDLVKKLEESFGEVEKEINKIEQYINTLREQLLPSVEEDSEAVEFLESQLKVREMWIGFGLDQREEYEQRRE